MWERCLASVYSTNKSEVPSDQRDKRMAKLTKSRYRTDNSLPLNDPGCRSRQGIYSVAHPRPALAKRPALLHMMTGRDVPAERVLPQQRLNTCIILQ
jgi:hypothetical protein